MKCTLFSPLRNALAFLTFGSLLLFAGPGITPAKTEINIGPLQFDLYTSSGPHAAGSFGGCPAAWTIRQCVKRMFTNNPSQAEYDPNNYVRQGVTGVRFMFAIGGGYESTPFPGWQSNPSNNVSSAWASNMNAFLGDLKSYGIQRITPTPIVREDWAGDDRIIPCPADLSIGQYGCTVILPSGAGPILGTGNRPIRFAPWSPYGYVHEALCTRIAGSGPCPLEDGREDGTFVNGAYNQAAANPYFTGSGTGKWGGWPKFLNLMDKVFELTSTNQLQLGDVDLMNEMSVYRVTVQGRFIFDNTTNVDVLKEIQDRLANRGFSRGLATYSMQIERPSVVTNPLTYCLSPFGAWGNEDPGQLPQLSALGAALAGKRFGVPPYLLGPSDRSTDLMQDGTAGLGSCLDAPARNTACNDPASRETCRFLDMPEMSVDPGRVETIAINVHSHNCKGTNVNTLDFDNSTPSGCTQEDSTQISKALYNAVNKYVTDSKPLTELIVFGETNGNQPTIADGFSPAQARWNATGFLQSDLYSARGTKVAMRPWLFVANAEYVAPHSIAPYATAGPPTAVSLEPSDRGYVEAAGSRSFSAIVTHAGSPSSVTRVEILFNREATGPNGCWLRYYPPSGTHELMNDAGTAPVFALNDVLQNTECSIGSAAGTITKSIVGQDTFLTIPITFRAAVSRLSWLRAFDSSVSIVSWVPQSRRPIVSSVSPGAGSGTAASPLSVVFKHPRTRNELTIMNVLIRDGLLGNQACYLTYDRRNRQIGLASDAAVNPTPNAGFVVPGVANTSVENSQCKLTTTTTDIIEPSGANDTLTWNMNLTFKQPAFAKDVVVYAAARDGYRDPAGAGLEFNNSGWQWMGIWRVPQTTPTYPRTTSVSPAPGAGAVHQVTATFEKSSAQSGNPFMRGWILVRPELVGSEACYFVYAREYNLFFLVNDSGGGVEPTAVTPGSSITVENSQCRLSGLTSSVSFSGNTMTVIAGLTYMPSFAGRKLVYTSSQIWVSQTDSTPIATQPWAAQGAWTVP